MWMRLSERPGGTRLFSAAANGESAAFRLDRAACGADEPGFAEVTVPKWPFVKSVAV
jgi:hypothetical protein